MLYEPARLLLSVALLSAQPSQEELQGTQVAPAEAPPASAQRASVAIAGSPTHKARLLVALSDAMRRLGIDLQPRSLPADLARNQGPSPELPPPNAVDLPMTARLLIDLREGESVTLYVVDDQRERVFVRRFETPTGLDEVALEQLVLAAASSIEAVLAGRLIGVARRDYEAASRPREHKPAAGPSADTKPRSLGSLSAAYTSAWLGPATVAHGPALGLQLERLPWGVGLRMQGYLPVLVGADNGGGLQVRLTTLGFRYRGWLVLPISRRVSLLPGIGAGADFTQVSPRSDRAEVLTAAKPYWAADGMLQAYVAVAYRSPRWSLSAVVGGDSSLRPVRYAVELAPGMRELFSPFRLRPFLEIELTATVLP